MNRHSRIWLTGAAVLAFAISCESYISSAQAGTKSSPTQKSGKTAPVVPTETYIIRYIEPPLASYDGSMQNLAAIPRTAPTDGTPKLDVHSPEARAYVAHLQRLQNGRVSAMQNLLGHSVPVRTQMQHALNAIVVDLSAEDLKRVKRMEGVEAVERDVYRPLATDTGPGFIGASTIWWGARAGQDTMFATSFEDDASNGGQGIVIGDIDTGYNSASPSFTATDDKGYTVTNPLGAGMYLGQCAVSNIARAPCNSKVIGVYDEIGLTTTPLPSTFTVEDTGGHGSHTASTSAGNSRTATIRDLTTHISGVAPHANLIVYRACDANGCKQSATSSAVNHAVADGVVDVLTYSISGGTDMWEDSTSMAFLNATAAGIAIAAAGGNTSPTVPNQVPGTVNHLEPWVLTVAASTHQTKAQGGRFSVTGPGTPPSNTQNINANEATGSTFTASVPGTTRLVVSPNFNITTTTGTDGCTAYPANTFQNAIALISRGTCTFGTKTAAAIAAGAVAVLISDNRAEDAFGATLGTTVARPVFAISQASGMALQAFASANMGTTMQLPYHYERNPVLPDQLARFSLLGPGEVNVIKPEVQAPGVSILAAVARSGTDANTVDFLDGTSMATPHTAGAMALVRAAHPTWSPMEVKSALVMTSKEAGLTKADAVTASDPFDRGAGRIQVDQAIKTALTMDETNFNAYKFGADMATLNMPSMQTNNCITPVSPPTPAVTSNKNCSFTRIFRNVTNIGTPTLWTATLSGVSGTVTPSNFTSYPDTNQNLTIQVDATSYASDGAYHFGKLTLTPTNHPEFPTLHLPIAVAIQQPTIFTQRYMQIDIPTGTTTATGHLNIANSGGPSLTISNTNLVDTGATTHTYLVANQPVPHVNNGTASSFLTDAMSGIYAADDFYVAGDPSIAKGTVSLSKIDVTGFMTATHTLASLAGHHVHFEIYADNGAGAPNGAPEAITNPADPTGDPLNPGDPGNELPVWSFVGTIGGMMGTTTVPQSPGLTITSASGTDRIVLDLTNPMYTGDHPSLFTGKYWLVVYPETTYGTAATPVDKLWAWAQSSVSTGSSPWTQFAPAAGQDPLAWTPLSDNAAMRIEQNVQCGASWMTATIPSLTLPGKIGSNVLGITVNNSLTAFDHAVGYLCLQSNDATNPVTVVRVDVYQH